MPTLSKKEWQEIKTMGATNNINETNISLQIEGKECGQCHRSFNEKDVEERNWDIWFDTTNDVKLIEMEKIKEKIVDKNLSVEKFNENYWDLLYYPFGRSGYQFSIWIRSIDHKECDLYSDWVKDKENDVKG